jgi:hypothetical protein
MATNEVTTIGCVTAPQDVQALAVVAPELRACIWSADTSPLRGIDCEEGGHFGRGLLVGLGLCLPFWAVVAWFIVRAIHL